MNEELHESANLHALGLLTGDALEAFVLEMNRSPELREEVRRLQEAAFALACSAPQVQPPADLRAQILTAFQNETPEPTATTAMATGGKPASPSAKPHATNAVEPPQSGATILHFIPWAAAAALGFLLWQDRGAIDQARQETAAAQAAGNALREREQHLLSAAAASESAKNQAEANLRNLRQALATAEASLANLGKERDSLIAELSGLRDDDKLNKTRLAVMGSLLKNQPQAIAVSLWRQDRQDGLLVVENLPTLPAGKDYQLWVIDPNQKVPVSAGVFKVDAEGKVRIEFKPARNVQSAYKFAVTQEKEGGAEAPTMDQMVVIGG